MEGDHEAINLQPNEALEATPPQNNKRELPPPPASRGGYIALSAPFYAYECIHIDCLDTVYLVVYRPTPVFYYLPLSLLKTLFGKALK